MASHLSERMARRAGKPRRGRRARVRGSPPRRPPHELGHYVLGHEGDFFCPFDRYATLEREANLFAAALLMPKAVVKTLWLKLSDLTPAAKLSALAERLEVSLGYRLQAVGIAGYVPAAPQRV